MYREVLSKQSRSLSTLTISTINQSFSIGSCNDQSSSIHSCQTCPGSHDEVLGVGVGHKAGPCSQVAHITLKSEVVTVRSEQLQGSLAPHLEKDGP